MYLTGQFGDKRAAARAIEELKAHGMGAGDLDVFSTEPVMFEPGVLDRKSHMSLAAALGAATTGVSATAFIWYSQHNYPLVTGGMPIFSFWATGVPSYELTMFGAIITTFGYFLLESGMLRGVKAPVPAVEPGSIHLRVRCSAPQAVRVRQCLSDAGAQGIQQLKEGA